MPSARLGVALVATFAVALRAQNPSTNQTATAVRITAAPRIDGRLTEEIWRTAPAVTVHTSSGQLVNTLRGTGNRGINRIVWNLRETDLPIRGGFGGDDDAPAAGAGTPGPLVAPGTYVVRLVAAGRTLEQKVDVREDPRIDISPAERKQWTDAVHQAAALAREFGPVNDRIQKLPGTSADVTDLKRQSRELIARISGLYGALGRWTGAPTKDQISRLAYYQQMVKTLASR